MANTLTIDRGNTSSKLVIWDASRPVAVVPPPGSESGLAIRQLPDEEIVALALEYGVTAAAGCSVAAGLDSLREALVTVCIPLTIVDSSTPLPIAIDYGTPDTLGADRIAAAVGAQELFPGRETLIVDIGTAATYDRVTADGRFIGGNIAPGVGMRLRALHAFTSRLPEVKSQGETPQWGYSTETAMRSGAIFGVVGEITYYRSLLGDDAAVVLTGGWSADIARYLNFEVTIDPLLVNKGLNRILHFQKQ